MKYKIAVKTIGIVEIEAETAEAAVENFLKAVDPRTLGGPLTYEIIEDEQPAAQQHQVTLLIFYKIYIIIYM